jgi:eukaryotic-like serine/threonine-protein kinase
MEVALKVLSNESAFDEHTLERFKAEIRVLQEVRHPNIVAAYDFIALDHTIAYTMEYVRGQDLAKILQLRTITFTEIDLIFDQLLSALHELHSKGIFHRDLKLENLLYSTEMGVKLSDFGLVRQEAHRGLTRVGVLLGTAQYMPPEYIRASLFDARSDLYCSGILLYELLSRRRYLEDKHGAEAITYLIEKEFQIPCDVPPHVPAKYVALMRCAMEPRPERRFQSAAEMRDAFRQEGGFSKRKEPERSVETWSGKRLLPRPLRILLFDPFCVALEITLLLLALAILWKAPWAR